MEEETEFVDLVDDKGIIRELDIPRSKINTYPNLHLQIAIGVIFDDGGKILVERRSLTKSTEAGKIDHVCGAIQSGESPEQAISRESIEETGILPINLKTISRELNLYGCYKYLLVGEVHDNPEIICSNESEWVKFMSNEELKEMEKSGELEFVKDFFENNQLAIEFKLKD